MSAPSNPPDSSMELEQLLGPRGADAREAPAFDEMFSGLKKKVDEADKSWLGRLRAQSTPMRRMMAFVSFGIIVGLKITTGVRPDLGSYPPMLLALYMISLGALLSIAMVAALRPVHLPPLARWKTAAFTALAIAATCILAVAPGMHAHVDLRPDAAAPWLARLGAPCFAYGLAIGLPVYGVLRVLDRGNPLGRLLAASAAGLAGNMVLEIHCPVGGAPHLLAGHAMVLIVFVFGVIAAELIARAR